MAQESAGRQDWIDNIRGLAALYVVFHHACLNVAGNSKIDGIATTLKYVFGWGHCAVDVFIVLSGYCLMLPILERGEFGSVLLFMARRTVRVIFPYYAACALSLILIYVFLGEATGTHWDSSIPVTNAGIFSHLLLIHQWWPQTRAQINHALWSVGAEYQIYLSLPMIFFAIRRFGVIVAVALIIPFSLLLWRLTAQLRFPDPSPWGASIYYVGLFALGAGTAAVARGHFKSNRPLLDRVALVGLGLFLLSLVVHGIFGANELSLQVLSYLVGSATSAVILIRSRLCLNSCYPAKNEILNWLGARSFSLYLVHAPILQLVWLYAVHPMRMSNRSTELELMFCFGTAFSLLSAECFYRAIEKPCLRMSRTIGIAR